MKSAAVFTLVAAAMIATCSCAKQQAAAAGPPPPPQVDVAEATQQDVPIYGDWVATLEGYQNAQIQPQVSGYLLKQNYKEGSQVHKGDVLFEIDPRPFQAALDQSKGQLAQAQGQLAQAQAALQLAEINVKRDTPLAGAHAIAQSQLDNDLQTRAQQQAQVASSQASIAAAQAAVERAQLDVGFTQVRSLIDGVAGVTNTQIGNLVSSSTILTTVSQVSPIKVYFSISESEYLRMTQGSRDMNWVRTSKASSLELTLATGEIYKQRGQILFADRQVNAQTGTILIVASFANPGNILRPGQFGRIRALTGVEHGAVLVPQRSVSELQGQHQVALVGADNKVSIRPVQVGDKVGSLWIVHGVNPGDHVVTEGLAKVRDGSPVQPRVVKLSSEGA